MLTIRDPTDADRISDSSLRSLVHQRLAEILDGQPYDRDVHGDFIVVESGDTATAVEEACGWPLLTNPLDETHLGDPDFVPLFEWIVDHPRCYELAVIANDEGSGILMYVPKQQGIDPTLLSLCDQFAESTLT